VSVGDLVQFSLFAGLVGLLLMMAAGAVRFRPSRLKNTAWTRRLALLGRYTLVRLPVAIGVAVAAFVLGAAALTLNSHRPPGDNSPVITVPATSGDATVSLSLDSCSGDLTGRVKTSGRLLGDSGRPRIFTDQSGLREFPMRTSKVTGERRGAFEIEDPTARRGLLSCYVQLPVVRGPGRGYSVHLELGSDMEVDTESSVPAPEAYTRGEWIWECPAGHSCPGFAAVNYSVEDGTKQVIVLVLAAVFGALIALLGGEVMITWARRRFGRGDSGD